MWYASCSSGAHWIPSIVAPGEVLDAGARNGPASIVAPSGPAWPALGCEGPALAFAPVLVVCAGVVVDEVFGGELPPHAAPISAVRTSTPSSFVRGIARKA